LLERAWIEYAATPYLALQAGHWLTPYGIWNVDHGSPVIIGVTRPFVIGEELLPNAQVGLLAYGSVPLVSDVEIGYALGLSNGRMDTVAFQDLDRNKAVTARAALTYRALGELTVGGTLYTGRYTRGNEQLYLEGNDPKSRFVSDRSFRELSYAFDAKWLIDDFHLQAEVIGQQRVYKAGKRPERDSGLRPDHSIWGGYVLAGYRLPFAVMPYAKAESSPEDVSGRLMYLSGGLNVRPAARVVLKGEYGYAFFPEAGEGDFSEPLHGVDFQIAWAF
jgi:hypothetical protein